jgi:glutamine---fructose-6-phosphate transaminase (isomerizing)
VSVFRDEIFEQPDALERLFSGDCGAPLAAVDAIRRRNVRTVVVAARGSSDNAARYAGYVFGAQNRLPVALALPSLFTLYDAPPRMHDTLVIGISQSGETPDVVAVVEEARRQSALTLAITGHPDSALGRAAEHVLDIHTGEERAVTASKTYTGELGTLALLSALLSGDGRRLGEIEALPAAVRKTLAMEEEIAAAAKRWRFFEKAVVLGRGYNFATAFEVALKLEEASALVAEPFSSADFLHGPLALMARGFPVMVIAPDGAAAPSVLEAARAAASRNADLLVISDRDDLLAVGRHHLRLPAPVPEWLSPLSAVVPGQLFALALAQSRGLDPDRPAGLSKVTATR